MKKFTFTVILSILLFSALSCEKTKEELTKECKKLISKKDYKDAKEVCQNACKKGSGLGCYFLARLEKNYEEMKNLLDKACNLQLGDACKDLGNFYRIEGYRNRAFFYYGLACIFGHDFACDIIELYTRPKYYKYF